MAEVDDNPEDDAPASISVSDHQSILKWLRDMALTYANTMPMYTFLFNKAALTIETYRKDLVRFNARNVKLERENLSLKSQLRELRKEKQ